MPVMLSTPLGAVTVAPETIMKFVVVAFAWVNDVAPPTPEKVRLPKLFEVVASITLPVVVALKLVVNNPEVKVLPLTLLSDPPSVVLPPAT